MVDESSSGTSRIQMYAQQVVEQQAKYCEAKMEHLEDKIDDLYLAREQDRQSLSHQIEQLTQTVEHLRNTQEALKVDLAVQKTKIALWAAAGGSLPALVMLLLDFLKK